MRRLNTGESSEHGAASVLVAILMVTLLGFAALAVDVGMLYAERAQLQNGADAAAIGIAQKCAADTADPECTSTSALARDLANGNAADGLSNMDSFTVDTANRKVTASVGAQEAGGSANRVSLFFAQALGVQSAQVKAQSTAIWGSPASGRTPFPLTFSVCQVEPWVEGDVQLLRNHGSGANPSCSYGPSGSTVSGGFGWLSQGAGSCGAVVDLAENEGGSDTGNDGPTGCDDILNFWAGEINAGRRAIVELPIYDQVTGTGSTAVYHLKAFAAFDIKGWKFSGSSFLPLTFHNRSEWVGADACTGECRGIIGTFLRYVSLSDSYTLGPVSPYGATVVRFTE